jgi:uncharacterized membrane protein required for colicin V production
LRPVPASRYSSPGLAPGGGFGAANEGYCVDFVSFFNSFKPFDLVVLLGLFAMFVLGYVQGTIRRAVGLLSIIFAFFLSAVLSVPVSNFLGQNWTYYPPEYSQMVGFIVPFVAAVVALALVVQGTYTKQEIFVKYPVVDEVLGGILGVCYGLLLLLFVTIILDQYYLNVPVAPDNEQLGFLRTFWTALDGSGTGSFLHTQVIPQFVGFFSFLLPEYVKATYAFSLPAIA